jgi:cytochrome c oxidase subunit II
MRERNLNQSRTPLLLLTLLVVAFGTVGCAENFPQSAISPASDFTRMLDDLFNLTVILAAFVFVVVNAILLYVLVKFRARPGDPLPPQTHGNARLEIGWTIPPVILLAIIAVPTVQTIFRTYEVPASDVRVVAVGKQWWWEFNYPELGIITANEMHVPVGEMVTLELESTDVIHSFWIPRLAAKRDMIPGRTNTLWFTADEPGEFLGQCAEFCGASHANMNIRVFVHARDEYDAWVQRQMAPPPAPATAEQQRGFQIVTTQCAACHAIRGTPAQGRIGPDLTDYGNRTMLAAMVPNTEENLHAWLRNPPAFKPGALMPNLNLPEEDVRAVSDYLMSLR